MYNVSKTLNEETFRKLEFLSHLSKKISLNQFNLKNEGPVGMIIVRDFNLEADITADEEVEKFLKETNSLNNPEAEKRNKIKRIMKNFFKPVGNKPILCYRLSQPTDSKRELLNLHNMAFHDLDIDFQKEFSELVEDIKPLIKAKAINGSSFNGIRLVEFIKLVVDSINTNRNIALYDIMSMVRTVEGEIIRKEHLIRKLRIELNL